MCIRDSSNDGVVPSSSQAYGQILGVFASDHLDCVGHYPHTLQNGTEVSGWVRSGADFTEARLELLWGRIADFVAKASRGRKSAAKKASTASAEEAAA